MQNRLARADVPLEMTWDLSDLFASTEQWEAAFEALDSARAEVDPYQGRLGDDAATLRRCLDTVETLQQRFMRVSTFAYLRNAQDWHETRNTRPRWRASTPWRPDWPRASPSSTPRRSRWPTARSNGSWRTTPAWRRTGFACRSCWRRSRTAWAPTSEGVLASLGECAGRRRR